MAAVVISPLRQAARNSLDIGGVVLAGGALLCFTFVLIDGQNFHWGTVKGPITVPRICIAGAVLTVSFILLQRRLQRRSPLLPFEIFADRNFGLMNVVMVTIYVVIAGTSLPLVMFAQYSLGYSPFKVGTVMFPMFLMVACVAPFCGRLADKLGGKYLLLFGLIVYGAGMAYLALVARPSTTWIVLLPGLFLSGLGLGCTIAPMNSLALYKVRPELAGSASGLMNTARQVGSVLETPSWLC